MICLSDPERQLEPPEYEPLGCCDACGEEFCEGDAYYTIDETTELCECCAEAWLQERRRIAERDDYAGRADE